MRVMDREQVGAKHVVSKDDSFLSCCGGGVGVEVRQTSGEKWVPQRHSVSQHAHDFTSKRRESHSEERHTCPCPSSLSLWVVRFEDQEKKLEDPGNEGATSGINLLVSGTTS